MGKRSSLEWRIRFGRLSMISIKRYSFLIHFNSIVLSYSPDYYVWVRSILKSFFLFRFVGIQKPEEISGDDLSKSREIKEIAVLNVYFNLLSLVEKHFFMVKHSEMSFSKTHFHIFRYFYLLRGIRSNQGKKRKGLTFFKAF